MNLVRRDPSRLNQLLMNEIKIYLGFSCLDCFFVVAVCIEVDIVVDIEVDIVVLVGS